MGESKFKYKPNEIERALIETMIKDKFYFRIINLGDENTTREEQEMEFLKAYLQDGYPLEEAEKKAKENLEKFLKFIEEMERQNGGQSCIH
ncbi:MULTISPECIES: hypothetical protein [Thermodesulfovibrio]|jgi:hypothetical protein|uniref:hypothetical protein n=1 Tax=Thermodesulfovibrio TaxID=28261 RepID=UPI0003FB689E|nr:MULTISPECIES: hypothetical protein [Thermodesulfovibrio]